jgi:hypothetical protein
MNELNWHCHRTSANHNQSAMRQNSLSSPLVNNQNTWFVYFENQNPNSKPLNVYIQHYQHLCHFVWAKILVSKFIDCGLNWSRIFMHPKVHRSRGSSVSIVSGYEQNYQAIEVLSVAGTMDFSSCLCVQTGSGAHPASCPMGTAGKARPGRDADHTPI